MYFYEILCEIYDSDVTLEKLDIIIIELNILFLEYKFNSSYDLIMKVLNYAIHKVQKGDKPETVRYIMYRHLYN